MSGLHCECWVQSVNTHVVRFGQPKMVRTEIVVISDIFNQ